MGTRLAKKLLIVCALALAACEQLGGYTSIADIRAAPGRYEGQEEKIRGVVRATTKMPFVDLRTFLIEQGGQDLLVITAGPLPAEGTRVALRGVVESAAIVEGRAFGLRVREIERL